MIRPDLYQDLEYRGIVKQVTDPELANLLSGYKVTLYAGFDPTSDSLHVGNLLPLMTLRRFQLAGHRPIAVVGGATGMIGDPSGKSQERNLLDDEQIAHNLRGISAVIARFLELKGKDAGLVVNNADWFKGMDYIRFLRDIGKHFTINHMMAKESVRARLEDREHGISYTEFSYMLLQAYDFYVLNRQNGCQLQIGGSDQWGNITAGIELIRRIRATEEKQGKQPGEVFGMTHPLVSKADGTKFGKTEKGAVWLDAKRTSPYQFYQFFVQTADADVVNYLKFFTLLAHDEIAHLEELAKKDPARREAQTKLAREMTRLVHGEKELERAERASEALFGGGIAELDERTLLDAFSEAPSTRIDKSRLGALTLVDLLAETGLSGSKGAARKDIAGGGIYLNNERVSDPATTVASTALIAGGYVVLRKGKKTYHLVSFT
jgi:tyrosyl-tRNA synthetase